MSFRPFSYLVLFSALIGGGVYVYRTSAAVQAFNLEQLQQQESLLPVAIIGSGPAGMGAALYAARSGHYTVIFEGSKPGGLLTETTAIENWPGEKSILGPQLIANLKAQNQALGVKFVPDLIDKVDFSQWPYQLTTSDGVKVLALSVIIATGATPRRLGIVGEQQYWGKGVSACAICDAPYFKAQNVVVVGGGDSALEQVLQLSSYAKKIEILVRGERLRASYHMQKRVQALRNVLFRYNVEIEKIIGDGQNVTAVEILDKTNGEKQREPVDGVFLAIGYTPNTKLVWEQLRLDSAGYIKIQFPTQKSSQAGVFAAGEVTDFRYRQAAIAYAEGNKAALDADRFLQDIGFNAEIALELQSNYYQPQIRRKSMITNIITLADFEQEVAHSELPVILDFLAPTCPACKHMLPAFEDLAQKYGDRIKFVKVNSDEAEDLVRKFYVLKVPCFIVYQNGRLAARYQDYMDKKQLTEFVLRFINGAEQNSGNL